MHEQRPNKRAQTNREKGGHAHMQRVHAQPQRRLQQQQHSSSESDGGSCNSRCAHTQRAGVRATPAGAAAMTRAVAAAPAVAAMAAAGAATEIAATTVGAAAGTEWQREQWEL
jgi:hypothetical protein